MADQLLQSAKDASYYTIPLPELEKLYELSEKFTESRRLTVREADWYLLLEQHFYLCLLTGNDAKAKLMLQRATDKFGTDSERVASMRTAFVQATNTAENFEKYLLGPNGDGVIPGVAKDPVAIKRQITPLKAAGKWEKYIEKLVEYVDKDPTDAEAWAELANAYVTTGNFEEAVQSLGQVLLLSPYAYPIFARIGELRHSQASAMKQGIQGSTEQLVDSVANFCRAVELCPNYIRGWAGIYVVSSKLLQWPRAPDRALYEKLQKKAAKELRALIKANTGTPEDLEAAKKVLQ